MPEGGYLFICPVALFWVLKAFKKETKRAIRRSCSKATSPLSFRNAFFKWNCSQLQQYLPFWKSVNILWKRASEVVTFQYNNLLGSFFSRMAEVDHEQTKEAKYILERFNFNVCKQFNIWKFFFCLALFWTPSITFWPPSQHQPEGHGGWTDPYQQGDSQHFWNTSQWTFQDIEKLKSCKIAEMEEVILIIIELT